MGQFTAADVDLKRTSLLSVGTFGLTTAINYTASGLVDWLTAGYFIVGGIGGGLVGTMTAARLATHRNTLSHIFRWVIFVVGLYVLLRSIA
ncbi:TSUP family transporter (plasmid) [Agrobacterium leguminum]|nr:TSUP family transporter [Agrobacterium leguminum]WLE00892.1 TSUP family transporter [Agrobacterium leguminum]